MNLVNPVMLLVFCFNLPKRIFTKFGSSNLENWSNYLSFQMLNVSFSLWFYWIGPAFFHTFTTLCIFNCSTFIERTLSLFSCICVLLFSQLTLITGVSINASTKIAQGYSQTKLPNRKRQRAILAHKNSYKGQIFLLLKTRTVLINPPFDQK